MRLYYHKTDGGAEYLTDKFIECPNGHREGVFEGARFIVRIDGDIAKDAELQVNQDTELLERLRGLINIVTHPKSTKEQMRRIAFEARAAMHAANA